MKKISITDLLFFASDTLNEIATTSESFVVTRYGHPVATLGPANLTPSELRVVIAVIQAQNIELPDHYGERLKSASAKLSRTLAAMES